MTDLDFDELDRAVNSLMSGKPDDKSASKSEVPSVAEEAAPENKTDSDSNSPSTAAEAEEEPSTQLQKRSTGQYMDMMPSKQQAQSQVATLKSHGATALSSPIVNTSASAAPESPKPSVPFHDVIPPKAAMNMPSTASEGLSPEPPLTPQDSLTTQSGMPDTDVQSQLQAALDEEEQGKDALSATQPDDLVKASDETPQLASESQEPDKPNLSSTTEDADTKPLVPASTTSPFLADAKVEKRPLGGATAPEQDEKVLPDESAPKDGDEKNVDPTPPPTPNGLNVGGQLDTGNVQAQPAPTPPEFHEDLLAVEADRHTGAAKEKSQDFSEASDQATPAHVGPITITQQYKEKMSSGDQSHTPIYDTNLQPLAHPAQKKSGWGVVALIVAVIVVFVGIAAVLYFTGIL